MLASVLLATLVFLGGMQQQVMERRWCWHGVISHEHFLCPFLSFRLRRAYMLVSYMLQRKRISIDLLWTDHRPTSIWRPNHLRKCFVQDDNYLTALITSGKLGFLAWLSKMYWQSLMMTSVSVSEMNLAPCCICTGKGRSWHLWCQPQIHCSKICFTTHYTDSFQLFSSCLRGVLIFMVVTSLRSATLLGRQ